MFAPHPNYEIFLRSFFAKKRPLVPAGTSAFFFLRTFSFCAFGFKKKKCAYSLDGFTTAVL